MLNLAVKLYLTNAVQTELLCQYIFSLARYDQNYDIRDRARFLKQFIFPASGQPTILSRNAKKIFLATKPAPLLESKYQGREQYQLGSLSHYLNIKATGYNDIPLFPKVAPDASVRNVESPVEAPTIDESVRMTSKQSKAAKAKSKSFYSESEKSSSEYSSDSDESDSESESADENGTSDKPEGSTGGKKSSSDETEDSDSDSSESDDSSSGDSDSDDDDSSSSSSDDENAKKMTNHAPKPQTSQGNGAKPEKSNLDLLLDLGDITPTGPVMTPSLGGFLTPMTQNVSTPSNRIELVGPNHIPLNSTELINKVNGYGLGVTYRFTRAPHLFSSTMVSIELLFTNHSNDAIEDIKIGEKILSPGMQLNEFAVIAVLPPRATVQGTLGIDFNDSSQPVSFDIVTKTNSCRATIKTTVGEFIRAILMNENVFNEERGKLRGMNEHSASIPLNTTITDVRLLQQRIYEYVNVASVPSSVENTRHFAGQTLSSQSLVLVTIEIGDEKATVMINCEKMVVGSMLLNEIKAALRN